MYVEKMLLYVRYHHSYSAESQAPRRNQFFSLLEIFEGKFVLFPTLITFVDGNTVQLLDLMRNYIGTVSVVR